MKADRVWKICVVTICIIAFCIAYLILNPYAKKILTVYNFENDIESMQTIVQEWESFDYSYMFIDRTRYDQNTIGVGYEPNDNITVSNGKECFGYLLANKKYRYIMKDDNAVYFTRYSSLGNGYGVAFSMDGNKPKNEFIISIEPLDNHNGWFFYTMR